MPSGLDDTEVIEAPLSQLHVTSTTIKHKTVKADIVSGSELDESKPEDGDMYNIDKALISKLFKPGPSRNQVHEHTTNAVGSSTRSISRADFSPDICWSGSPRH